MIFSNVLMQNVNVFKRFAPGYFYKPYTHNTDYENKICVHTVG